MTDDIVATFQLESAPVRGRWARLGPGTIDPILRRHDYPRAAALLLGEALTLSALIASLFKVNGRVTLQVEGDGAVPLLVAECRTDGGLRGMLRVRDGDAALEGARALPPKALLGEGVLAITLDQGPGTDLMQGFAPLEGETLASCAESYFRRSEQVPTDVRLAVGEDATPGRPALWRSGGALIQPLAADAARPGAEEAWDEARLLFATLSDHELVDPSLGADRALYRLFHEGGVRMAPGVELRDVCACGPERLSALLAQLPDKADLVEPDGLIHARCEFCGRLYLLDPAD